MQNYAELCRTITLMHACSAWSSTGVLNNLFLGFVEIISCLSKCRKPWHLPPFRRVEICTYLAKLRSRKSQSRPPPSEAECCRDIVALHANHIEQLHGGIKIVSDNHIVIVGFFLTKRANHNIANFNQLKKKKTPWSSPKAFNFLYVWRAQDLLGSFVRLANWHNMISLLYCCFERLGFYKKLKTFAYSAKCLCSYPCSWHLHVQLSPSTATSLH